jgi:hypothetical protein
VTGPELQAWFNVAERSQDGAKAIQPGQPAGPAKATASRRRDQGSIVGNAWTLLTGAGRGTAFLWSRGYRAKTAPPRCPRWWVCVLGV